MNQNKFYLRTKISMKIKLEIKKFSKNFMVGGGGNFPGVIFLWGIFQGDIFLGGIFPRIQFIIFIINNLVRLYMSFLFFFIILLYNGSTVFSMILLNVIRVQVHSTLQSVLVNDVAIYFFFNYLNTTRGYCKHLVLRWQNSTFHASNITHKNEMKRGNSRVILFL